MPPWNPRENYRRLEGAIETVRSEARDLSRSEVRQRLWAELRSRGIMPAPPTVDRVVDDIMLSTDVAGRVRRSAKRLAAGAELAGFAGRLISVAIRHRPLPRWDSGGIRSVRPDLRVREQVIIGPAAQELLAVGESRHLRRLARFCRTRA